MKTLNISITDNEYETYQLKKEECTFAEILALLNRRQINEKLQKSIELAALAGLSNMTLEEINGEINAARQVKNIY